MSGLSGELRAMAERAGICVTIRQGTVEMLAEETLEAFARLVAEDCAKVAAELQFTEHGPTAETKHQRELCANAIRSKYGLSGD